MINAIKKNHMTFLFILSAICVLIVGFATFPLPEPALPFSFDEAKKNSGKIKNEKHKGLTAKPNHGKAKSLSPTPNSDVTPGERNRGLAKETSRNSSLKESHQKKVISDFSSFEEYNVYFDRRKQHCLDNAKINFEVRACMNTQAQREEDISKLTAFVEENLTEEQLSLFHTSAKLWKQLEDVDSKLAKSLIDKKYPPDGTMYIDMRSGDISRSNEATVKYRLEMLFLFLDFSKIFDDSGL
jgi:hypothetical protein